MSATPSLRDGPVVADAAGAGHAAPVRVPGRRADDRLDNGLPVLVADLPGRPLVSASLVLPDGAADEPAAEAGLDGPGGPGPDRGHRALRRHRPHRGVRAPRRLAPRRGRLGRDDASASTCRPTRLEPALELLAEVLLHPTFPAAEVERLRDERLNDLLQAQADPRRRAEEAFIGTIYAPASPYHRPAGGTARDRRAARTATRSRRAYERGPRPGPSHARRRRRPRRPGRRRASPSGSFGGWAAGRRRGAAATDRRHGGRGGPPGPGRSTGRARSRPRSASATWACPGGSPTSTPCR